MLCSWELTAALIDSNGSCLVYDCLETGFTVDPYAHMNQVWNCLFFNMINY